jgi:hypothetical protein
MKKINGSLLKARMDDKQLLVSQASFLENLETAGKGANGIIQEAKKFLAINEDDSVIASNAEVIKIYNKTSNAVVSFDRALLALKELELLDSNETQVLDNLHKKLVEKICDLYDISNDELFLEE